MDQHNSIRLNKYISESGICSRREADRFIEKGVVYINGNKATIGRQVKPGDVVVVNGMTIEPREAEEAIYLAFNKPVGITCTTEEGTRDNIVNYINYQQRIFPIGRLDKDSQGLIFLTSDGNIVNKILRAGNNHEKEYLVTVNKPITDAFITGMSNGVPMLGTMTKKCFVQKEAPFVFRIILVQGLNRQIRRMCEHFGFEVVKLERIRIMNIGLKGLPLGEYRELTKAELAIINDMIRDSVSTEDASKKPKQKTNQSPGKSNQPKAGNNNHSSGQGEKSFKKKPGGFEKKFKKGDKKHGKPKGGPGKFSKKSSGKNAGGRSRRSR